MGQIFLSSEGGASSSDDCTGTKNQCLAGYTFITNDSDDEPVEGTIITYNNSGIVDFKNVTTEHNKRAITFLTGYYPNQHGVEVEKYNGDISFS